MAGDKASPTDAQMKREVRALIKMGLKQDTISEYLGLDSSGVTRWLKGERKGDIGLRAFDGFRDYLDALADTVASARRTIYGEREHVAVATKRTG